ncbi:hypothetical protein EC988_002536 [Linderina pennispora]|nr:hypothetical protein EC988_002536 [Linderina pennispora]
MPSGRAATPALCDGPYVRVDYGNFLEFCFSRDHCRCACHEDCPCNPCADIRQQRQRSVSTDSTAQPTPARVQSKESLDPAFRPFGDVAAVKPVMLHTGRKRHQRDYENARMRVSKIWADEKRRLCSMPTS